MSGPVEAGRLAGRIAVVTGSARGIGHGIARRFVAEGARVALLDADPRVESAAAELDDGSGRARGYRIDVSDGAAVGAVTDRVAAELGPVDVLVNNAGVITVAPLEELSEADWDRVLAVNTKGPFLLAKALLPGMAERGFGRMINIASGQARAAAIYTPHYAASKFGVIGLTQALAIEYATRGVTANAICPGVIGTEMWEYNDRAWGQLLGFGPGQFMQQWVDRIPMRRAGTPADIAGTVVFLASDDAAYLTGQAINVDGGAIMS